MHKPQEKVMKLRPRDYPRELRWLTRKLAYYHPTADYGVLCMSAITRIYLRCQNGE